MVYMPIHSIIYGEIELFFSQIYSRAFNDYFFQSLKICIWHFLFLGFFLLESLSKR